LKPAPWALEACQRVSQSMLIARQDDQILWTIIGLVPIAVMNLLFGLQQPSKSRLYY